MGSFRLNKHGKWTTGRSASIDNHKQGIISTPIQSVCTTRGFLKTDFFVLAKNLSFVECIAKLFCLSCKITYLNLVVDSIFFKCYLILMFKMLTQEGTTHCGKAVFKRVNVIVIVYILFHICFDSIHAHLESGGEQITLVNI